MEVLASSPTLQLKQRLVTNLPSQKWYIFSMDKGIMYGPKKGCTKLGKKEKTPTTPNRHLFHQQKCNNTFLRMAGNLQLGDFPR